MEITRQFLFSSSAQPSIQAAKREVVKELKSSKGSLTNLQSSARGTIVLSVMLPGGAGVRDFVITFRIALSSNAGETRVSRLR